MNSKIIGGTYFRVADANWSDPVDASYAALGNEQHVGLLRGRAAKTHQDTLPRATDNQPGTIRASRLQCFSRRMRRGLTVAARRTKRCLLGCRQELRLVVVKSSKAAVRAAPDLSES
ncbi:MAG: hypothetical protein OXB92_16435 [Acidimicrobiaceae bacterium]|nr:hypothetical protein [Acidimicrobiaceae bacterium]